MNLNDIYELMDRFEKSEMIEIELEFEGAKFICKKQTEANVIDCKNIKNDTLIGQKKIKDSDKANLEEEKFANGNTKVNGIEVKSVVAGTFYRAPSPDSEPFVQIGQKVVSGETIGMIEAMKMMNEIISPVDGEIIEIIPANEELVGYDDVIFIIKED